MKILIVGGGGREHAIAWKLSKENNVEKIYCAPGNAGIAKVAQCVNISDSDIENLVKFAKENNIDLTVVGPEVPLVNGIVDEFEKEGLKIFGPNKECSTFEGSKSFSKDFMIRHNIPTAKYKEYTNLDEAISEIDSFGYPVVIKADGLAAGKGVVIPENREDAINTLREIMSDKKFGSAGEKIVVEEFLSGIETSILAFVDNDTIVPMVSAKDHKKVYNFEKGPNTGGMGTFSPSEIYTDELSKEISEKVREMGATIIKGKGRTHYGIATCVCYLAEAVLNQRLTIAPVSTMFQGEYGIEDVCLSVPSIIGVNGVEKRLEERWAEEEFQAFRQAADKMKKVLKTL